MRCKRSQVYKWRLNLDRPDQFVHKFRTVAAVAVDEHDDIGACFNRCVHACPASSTVASESAGSLAWHLRSWRLER
jgi:hypothetical protein